MQIIVSTDSGKRYKISPTANGLCYQVYTKPKIVKVDKDGNRIGKNGKIIKEDWVFTEKYPPTIDAAFRCIAEMVLKDPDDDTEITCNINEYKEVAKAIKKKIDRLTVYIEANKHVK